MHSQQRRARRNREPKHVHALHVSPKRVLQWSYSHSPKKEHITKGFFWHHPSRSCQRAPSSHPETASPLAIPSIFNCLRSGRVLTRDVYMWSHCCVFPPFSPCEETLGTFQSPGRGSRALCLRSASSLHSQPAEVEAAVLWIPSPQRKSTQPKRSWWGSQVCHKVEMSWHWHLHNTKCCFWTAQLQREATNSPCPVASPSPTGPNPIADGIAFSFRGIQKRQCGISI